MEDQFVCLARRFKDAQALEECHNGGKDHFDQKSPALPITWPTTGHLSNSVLSNIPVLKRPLSSVLKHAKSVSSFAAVQHDMSIGFSSL